MQKLDDGIYFGLPADLYHADPSLGSSDIKLLAYDAAAYWFRSWLNPARPADKKTPSLVLGSAMHSLVLDGEQAFESRFVRRPDVARMTEKQRAVYAPNGEDILSGEDYDRVRLAAASIAAHPDLGAALSGGASEVSVFWTVQVDGVVVPRKARFDYLKPRAVVDLKSIAQITPMPFARACARAIAAYDYPVQAAAYLEARSQVQALVDRGAVFGDYAADWLEQVAIEPDYAFVWVFWASTGAPLVWATHVSPENRGVLDPAQASVSVAMRRYADCMTRHGTESAWIDYEPMSELMLDELPKYYGMSF